MSDKLSTFKTEMKRMAEYYGKTLNNTQLGVWWDELVKYDEDIIGRALRAATKVSPFMPTLQVVVEAAEEMNRTRWRSDTYRKNEQGKLDHRMDPKAREKFKVLQRVVSGEISPHAGMREIEELSREAKQGAEED